MFQALDSFVLSVRALSIVAMFQAAGGYLFLQLFAREAQASATTLRSIVRWSALAGVLLATLYYFLVRVRMAGSFSGMTNPVLAGIVAASSVHPAQILAVAGAAVIAATAGLQGAFMRSICLLGAAVVVCSFALTGHTSTHELRPLLAILLIVHVAVAAAWFGALWPLRVVCTKEPPAVRASIVQGFSRYAVRAIPVLLVCGIAMGTILVQSIRQALTPYGLMLGLKLAAFVAVLAVANYNRSRLVPAIAASQARGIEIFRRVLVGEAVMLAAIILITVLMTGFFSPQDSHASLADERGDETMHD